MLWGPGPGLSGNRSLQRSLAKTLGARWAGVQGLVPPWEAKEQTEAEPGTGQPGAGQGRGSGASAWPSRGLPNTGVGGLQGQHNGHRRGRVLRSPGPHTHTQALWVPAQMLQVEESRGSPGPRAPRQEAVWRREAVWGQTFRSLPGQVFLGTCCDLGPISLLQAPRQVLWSLALRSPMQGSHRAWCTWPASMNSYFHHWQWKRS